MTNKKGKNKSKKQIPFGDGKQERQRQLQLQRQPTLHDETVKDGPPEVVVMREKCFSGWL